MKHIMIFVFLAFFCIVGISAQKQIVVKNMANFNRTAETVELKVSKKNAELLKKQFVLNNEKGQEIAYQLVYSSNKTLTGIIFQANVNAKSSVTYQLIEGKPSALKFLTHARFVPERKDDFAWENDLAAYRMYGPALANENPSNGVDLWLKRTADTIVNKRYRDELKNGLSYHVDRGNGLDCYKVGHTMGAGGIAPYVNGKLQVGNHYNRYKILENGPLRSTFVLYYDGVKVGNQTVSQEITITTTAGSLLNKATVTYGSTTAFQVAAGIYTHDEKGAKYSNLTSGIIAYAEDAMQDANTAVGRNYVGVLIANKPQATVEQDNHLLLTANYKAKSNFTYYFGGGWSKWQFPTDKHWFEAMEKFSQQIKEPLQVSMK